VDVVEALLDLGAALGGRLGNMLPREPDQRPQVAMSSRDRGRLLANPSLMSSNRRRKAPRASGSTIACSRRGHGPRSA
jgi:hypothetical protein